MSWPSHTCSPWRVTHGSTIIVDWSDVLAGPPELPDAGQEVQVEPLVRAPEPFIAARGNETHRLQVVRIRDHGTPDAMWTAMLAEGLPEHLPRGKATLTIETRTGHTLTMPGAIIESWPVVPEDGSATRRTLTIIGGALVAQDPPMHVLLLGDEDQPLLGDEDQPLLAA